MNAVIALSVLSLVGTAAILDQRSQRIPNWLSYGGLVLALCLHGFGDGLEGLKLALSGAAIGGGMLLPLWLLGGLAAGDVKLMAAVGAFLGPAAAAFATAATLVAGGILGAAWLIRQKVTQKNTVRSFAYAPAIALGTAVTYFLTWLQVT